MGITNPNLDLPKNMAILPSLGGVSGLAALVLVLLQHAPIRLAAQQEGPRSARPATVASRPAPMVLPFQGRMTTPDGKPLPVGETTASFAIYDTPSGGTATWASGPLRLKVTTGGLVLADLGGEANPLDRVDFSREMYLGVRVDDPDNAIPADQEPELLPRVRISPTLFARRAYSSEDASTVRGVNVYEHTVPTGTILLFCGTDPPDGWLACDGRVLDPIKNPEYKNLASLLKLSFDANNTLIKLPDFQGRFPIGMGRGSGLSTRILGGIGGEEFHKLTLEEMPKHGHNLVDPGHSHGIQLGNNTMDGPDDWVQHSDHSGGDWGIIQTKTIGTGITLDTSGGNNSHNNMPPYTIVNFIIKYN